MYNQFPSTLAFYPLQTKHSPFPSMKKFERHRHGGHLASMFEMANTLQARDHRLAVTFIAMRLPAYDAKANELY